MRNQFLEPAWQHHNCYDALVSSSPIQLDLINIQPGALILCWGPQGIIGIPGPWVQGKFYQVRRAQGINQGKPLYGGGSPYVGHMRPTVFTPPTGMAIAPTLKAFFLNYHAG